MRAFGGDDAGRPSPANTRLVIIPCPYEGTVTYGKGTARGPGALLDASANMELYDEEFRTEPIAHGIYTTPPLKLQRLRPEAMVAAVEREAAKWLARGMQVALLGGEHSVTTGALRAYKKRCPKMGTLQFDAHSDFRDTYHGTPYNHACVMARANELGPTAGVGMRAVAAEEVPRFREKKHRVFYARETRNLMAAVNRVCAALPREIFITFDLDFFDPAVLPATGTPEPGGYGWNETIDFLAAIFKRKRVVGFDVVELAPRPGWPASDFLAAKLVYKMIAFYHLGWGRGKE